MALVTLDEALPESRDQSWLDGFERELRLGFELEKAQRMARVMEARNEVGPQIKNVEGLGQLKGVFDARTYFRWEQEDPGCWQDDTWVDKFLKDNPEYQAPKPEMATRITV